MSDEDLQQMAAGRKIANGACIFIVLVLLIVIVA